MWPLSLSIISETIGRTWLLGRRKVEILVPELTLIWDPKSFGWIYELLVSLVRSLAPASSPIFYVEEYATHLRSFQYNVDPVWVTFAFSGLRDVGNFFFVCVQPVDVVLAISRVKSSSVRVDRFSVCSYPSYSSLS